jgi:L-iditol 2-dehydrogenase
VERIDSQPPATEADKIKVASNQAMPIAGQLAVDERKQSIPSAMLAAVYRGVNNVRLETVPVPAIGAGELLVRVHTCGVCGTDLKKIATGSHSAPRIFGHETSGVVAAVGAGVTEFQPGDRVVVFHHIPCRSCYYCRHKTFAQCATYKKVGCTAGFEPSGGGFAEYVRVMDWIVQHGTVRIPEGVSFEQACFVEPVNTCMKGIAALRLEKDEIVLVIGQGPIGIMLSVLAQRAGARVITSDLYPERLKIGESFGLQRTVDASRSNALEAVCELTEGRGADAVLLAVGSNAMIRPAMDAARPGGRVLLFAQTQRGEVVVDPAAICVDEKVLVGSYSASVDLQEESVRFVMGREMALERLISHRFPLQQSAQALELAAHPQPSSMKIVIQPGVGWESKAWEGSKQ